MTTPAMQDQLQKITQFADHAVRCMVVKITALDLANGACSVDAQDGGGAIAGVPFYGYDPKVGDLCLAWIFDGTIAVMGNAPLTTQIVTYAEPVAAASGWAVTDSSLDYGKESAEIYLNVTRTGVAITGTSGGDITKITVGQVRAGLPLPAKQVGLSPVGGDRQVGGLISPSGVITLSFLGSNLTFDTGFTFNASATYIRGS
jgi:hypothetical protein